MHIRIAFPIEPRLRMSRLLANNWRASEESEKLSVVYKFKLVRYIYYKHSTLLRGISINIALKVGIFPEAEGRGKYSLPRMQYY